MTDDIVTRLRTADQYWATVLFAEAADEIERLRKWNVEVNKLLKQAQVCMDIWQKSEDELIEFHQGKSIEALTKQADEIERLTADRDRWRSLAERAMDLLDEANKVLATIQEGLKRD